MIKGDFYILLKYNKVLFFLLIFAITWCTSSVEPSIDASYKVLVHLAKRFQRRRLKCEKLTDDRRRTTDANSSHCLWQSELKPLVLDIIQK
jgi:hypothetical protein